jgi:hypothetical protein
MPDIPLDLTALLMIVVPGAITVWSYRFFTKSKKSGDFEYLTLSIFWGVVLLAIQPWISRKEEFVKLLNNPFATMLAMSILGIFLSFSLVFGYSWIGPRVLNKVSKKNKKAKRPKSK